MDDPAADPATHLRHQHGLVASRIERLRKVLDAIEFAMEARAMGINLTPEERFEVFGSPRPTRR